jgi:hypothetical protein
LFAVCSSVAVTGNYEVVDFKGIVLLQVFQVFRLAHFDKQIGVPVGLV